MAEIFSGNIYEKSEIAGGFAGTIHSARVACRVGGQPRAG
jgi:hypothetical protein